jgi:5-methylcytosine-specific restriction endonuclease McrA
MLRPHLTDDNHKSLLEAARHKSKREVEQQIAAIAPRPDAKVLIRRLTTEPDFQVPLNVAAPAAVNGPTLSEALPTETPPSPAVRPSVSPLASDRYLLRMTLGGTAHANLRRAQELMAHRVPDGDPVVIVEEALALLVAQLERTKIASVRRPREKVGMLSPSAAGSRHIPASIRRSVWSRDEGRCAFVGSCGRCTETSRLEFHHLVPFARGGPTTLENVGLRCRAHNRYESELAFGAWPRTAGEAFELDSR